MRKGIMKTKSFLIVASLLFLGGCSHDQKIAVISNDSGARNAEAKLADAATSVSDSLRQLAEIEQATHPQARLPKPPVPESIGMAQITSIEWSGPVEPLIKKIAEISHYKVRILGTAPAIPVLVSISAKDTPLADILRDAGFQCGDKANVVVYPDKKTIELRYKKF